MRLLPTNTTRCAAFLTTLLLATLRVGFAADWPMWRFDSGRTASSPHALPDDLSLGWTRRLPPRVQTWDDTLNNDLMQFDRVFEPIVLGNRVIVGFNDSDKVVCWNVESGEEMWRFYANGPVRMPPAGDGKRVFVTSDDGHLYCLSLSDGTLRWKIRGGPSDLKVLGNRRVISMWPARGGAVVRSGHVYFAASIWPFMGTFLYDIDAETGQINWVNDRTSSSYIKQPHSAASFAGVAPQGALAATDAALVVPGGRSIPAVFDRESGELVHFHLNAGGKGNGGSFVMTTEDDFFVHTRQREVRQFDLAEGKKTALTLNEPVLVGGYLVTSDATSIRAIDPDETGTEEKLHVVWEVAADGSGDLIRAGQRLYAAGKDQITVVQISDDAKSAQVVATLDTPNVVRLIAGGDALIAVTLNGQIHCHLAEEAAAETASQFNTTAAALPAPDKQTGDFLEQHDAKNGYALVFGVEDGELLDQLIASSDLHIVALSENAATVGQLRRHYDDLGVYGTRVVMQQGTPASFQAPPYIAQLVVVAADNVQRYLRPETLATMYRSVRPYGGTLWIPSASDGGLDSAADAAELARAKVSSRTITRVGSLEGAAPWTHLYGDIANTVKSNDRLVKAPLGLLWFGGNTHHDTLPRHSHSPCEQVLDGRLFVEGMNSLSARDVYTGRLLWRREFSDLGTKGIYFDDTYHDTPLSTQYNQVHIPGANARGTNFVAASDGIYLVIGARCEVLDPRTGETIRTITLPDELNPTGTGNWTYIGIYEDLVIAGVDFANGADAAKVLEHYSQGRRPRGSAWSPQWFASRRVAAMDRQTGELLWHVDARHSFLHNGIIAGSDKLFLLDKLPKSIEDQRARRGLAEPEDYRIVAIESASGETVWEDVGDAFGTWLSYSEEFDTLVHAGAAAPDRALDEARSGLRAIRGANGQTIWERLGLEYSGPCIIHNDKVIMNSRSYAKTSGVVSIVDGQPILIDNPITGDEVAWTYERTYGCNTAVASEHLLTFRSGAAGYYDLNLKCGVANLGGFRSGCSSNLIAADGVLNAPDFTRTCSCGYQNQTSLALIHMPEVEVWTVNPFTAEDAPATISRLGINFGAAGTRRAKDGTVWAEYPSASDDAFPVDVRIEGEPSYSRRHSSTQTGPMPWMTASHVSDFDAIAIQLDDSTSSESRRYTVRLFFQGQNGGEQVLVQGEAGQSGVHRYVEYADLRCSDGRISIQRVARGHSPIALAGIELISVD